MALRSAALCLSLAAGPVLADFDAASYPAYETCALCHGLFGVSHIGKFPNLAGQKPEYIRRQIEAFLSGARSNDGGQMAAIVTEMPPDAVPIVVEWFSTQTPPAAYDTGGSEPGQAVFAELGCAGCHDNSAEQDETVPYLSAQHMVYLEKQMTDFRDGARNGLPVHAMHADLLARPEADIAAIAAYLSAEERP